LIGWGRGCPGSVLVTQRRNSEVRADRDPPWSRESIGQAGRREGLCRGHAGGDGASGQIGRQRRQRMPEGEHSRTTARRRGRPRRRERGLSRRVPGRVRGPGLDHGGYLLPARTAAAKACAGSGDSQAAPVLTDAPNSWRRRVDAVPRFPLVGGRAFRQRQGFVSRPRSRHRSEIWVRCAGAAGHDRRRTQASAGAGSS
jgi:hypothetical protein